MHWKTQEIYIYFVLFPWSVGALMQKGLIFLWHVNTLCIPAAWLQWWCSEEMSLIAPSSPLINKEEEKAEIEDTLQCTPGATHPTPSLGAEVHWLASHAAPAVLGATWTPLSLLLLLICFVCWGPKSHRTRSDCKLVVVYCYYPFHRIGSDGCGRRYLVSYFSPLFLKLFFPVRRYMHIGDRIHDLWHRFPVIEWSSAWTTCWLNRQFKFLRHWLHCLWINLQDISILCWRYI